MYLKLFFLLLFFCFSSDLISQKKLTRPSEIVGITNIDSLVNKSFDLYDILFEYENRNREGEKLGQEDLCALEAIYSDAENIIQEAIAAKAYFKNENFFTRARATIQLERAKRAVYHSRDISKEILLAHSVQVE